MKIESNTPLGATPCSDSSDPLYDRIAEFSRSMAERRKAREAIPSFIPTREYLKEGILLMSQGVLAIGQAVRQLRSCDDGRNPESRQSQTGAEA